MNEQSLKIETFPPPRLTAPRFNVLADRLRVDLAQPDAQADVSRILFGGDWAAVREFTEISQTDPKTLYGSLLAAIGAANLAVVNLECPLGGEDPIIKDGPNFRCDLGCAAALAGAGFQIATLANNHIFDQGLSGLVSTLQSCRDAGLETVGAGLDLDQAARPIVRDVGGTRVGMIALADAEEGLADQGRGGAAPIFDVNVLDRCRSARGKCDLLVAIVHGGKEYAPYPSPYWYRQVLALVDAGVDAIIGHHPHVPQGVTIAHARDGRAVPVVFSTSNFVFPPRMPTEVSSAWMNLGYMVQLGLEGGSIRSVELLPYRIDAPRGIDGLEGDAIDSFKRFMDELCRPLADPDEVETWFGASADYFWEHEWRKRIEGLTAKMCRDDPAGLRHGRSHFHSLAHSTLIDRVITRKQSGIYGQAPKAQQDALADWMAGRWPVESGQLKPGRVSSVQKQ
ncbi:MAG: CapA family protein [Phycisphaeraceae bacterium]|nr:CapA family protein [Phycisphaeraceae bacterium]